MNNPGRALFCAAALSLAACGGDDTSGACDSDGDCDTGTCYTKTEPGYCTAPCDAEGNTAECPAGTVCKPIEGGNLFCILVCEEEADCPENSDCNPVSDTDLRGCEPVHTG